MDLLEAETPQDVPPLRDRLHAAGLQTFEADVRFAVRYLIDRGIKGGCEIEGEWVAGKRHVSQYIPIRCCGRAGSTSSCACCRSTSKRTAMARRLLAISMYGPGIDEVLIVDRTRSRHAAAAPDAARMSATALDMFCARVKAFDPDVITGWNVIDFDLAVLQRVAARLNHPLHPRAGCRARCALRKAEGYFGSGQASIPGRLVLDGIDLLRGAFVRMEEYSLDAVARQVLGEGKAVAGDVRDRLAEILDNYKHDLGAFALYARTDARLAYEIVEQLKLVRLAFARSQLTGHDARPRRREHCIVRLSVPDGTREAGVVAPTVRSDDWRSAITPRSRAAMCWSPSAGLHRNVWVFDFKSLYPSIIRTLNIDPLSYVAATGARAPI